MPVELFPLTALIPSTSDTSTWQSAVDQLMKSFVYVMYVSPEATHPELLEYLVNLKVTLIGGRTPPTEALPHWAATVRLDPLTALNEIWQNLLADQGGHAVDAPIQVTDINPEYLSPGRLEMAEKVFEELAAGWVSAISPPYP